MQEIRLLVSVAGAPAAPVAGDVGDRLTVTDELAAVWCDGVRAEYAYGQPSAPVSLARAVAVAKGRKAGARA